MVGAGKNGAEVKYLVQGTLYPDVVESGGGDGAANIKSHQSLTRHSLLCIGNSRLYKFLYTFAAAACFKAVFSNILSQHGAFCKCGWINSLA